MSLINSQSSPMLSSDRRKDRWCLPTAMVAMYWRCSRIYSVPTKQQQSAFFDATRLHYRNPLSGKIELPRWMEAQQRLASCDHATPGPLMWLTFGTPLRYRWNTRQSTTNLMHFVQHRPLDSERPARASGAQLYSASHGRRRRGDYIQQFGIGGTDFITFGLAWREWVVERRMREMFEPCVGPRELIRNLKTGPPSRRRRHDPVG